MINNQNNSLNSYNFHLPPHYSAVPNTNYRTLANHTADPFISGSSYEGNNFRIAIQRFIQTLPNLKSFAQLDEDQEHLLNSFIQGLVQASNRLGKIEEITTLAEVENYAKEIISEIRLLKEGEELWLPVGWQNGNSGHAMLCLVTRVDLEHLRLIFFNSGRGLEFHYGQINQEGITSQTSAYFEEILEEKLCQVPTIRNLIEPSVPHLPLRAENSVYNLYMGFVNALNVKFKKLSSPFFQKEQLAGSCTAQAIYAALNFQILNKSLSNPDKSFYKKIKFFLQLQDLLDTATPFLQSSSWSRSNHKLLLVISRKLGRLAKKLVRKNYISENEIAPHVKTLRELQGCLILKKQKATEVTEQTPLNYKLPDPPNFSGIAFEYLQPLKKHDPVKPFNIHRIPSHRILPSYNPADALSSLEIFIQESLEILKTVRNGEEFLPYLIHSLDYVMLLPVPTLQKDLWDEIALDRIPSLLRSLMSFAHYFYSHTGFSAQKALFAERSLALHTVLAIAEKLAKRTSIGKKYFKTPLFFLGLEFLSQTPYVVLSTFKQQHRLKQLLSYFNPSGLNLKTLSSQPFLFNGNLLHLSQDEELDLSDPTIKLYYDLLYDNAINKVFSKDHLPNNLKIFEMMRSVEEEKGNYLPVEIQSLHFLTIACLSLRPQENPSSQTTVQRIHSRSTFKFKLTLVQGKTAIYNTFGDDYRERDVHFSGLQMLEKMYSYRWLKPHSSPHLTEEKILPFFIRSHQNKIMAKELQEDQRHHEMLSLDIEDEVVRVLSYYANRPLDQFLFLDKYVLRQHLLSPGRLYEVLIQEPTFAPRLLHQLQGYFEHSILQKGMDACLYFADLGYACQTFIKEAQKTFPDKFIDPSLNHLFDFRSKILEKSRLDPLQATFYRDHLNQNLVSWHLKEYLLSDAARVEDCLVAELFLALNPQNENKAVNFTGSAFYKSRRSEASFFAILQDPSQRNSILNAVFARLLDVSEEFNWQGDFPHFSNDVYKVDLEKLKIYKNGKELTTLPEVVLKSPFFNQTFQQIREITIVGENHDHFEICDAKGLARLRLDSEVFSLQRQFNGDWFEYYFDQDENERLVHGNRIFNLPLLKKSEDLGKQLSRIFVATELHFWRNISEQNQWIISNSDRSVYLDLKEDGFTIFKDREHTLSLVDPLSNPDSSLQILTQFESKKFITFWTHQQQPLLIHSIELPRYGLQFEVKETPLKAYSKEIPGFFIAQDQISHFFDWEEHLVLENPLGQKKVILPKVIFTATETAEKRGREGPFAPSISYDLRKKNAYLVGELQFIEQKAYLKVHSLDDKFQLTLLHFYRKQYKKALYYLNECDVQNGIPEKMAETFFKQIYSNDGHPYAVAFRLKCLILFSHNSLKYLHKPSCLLSKEGLESLETDYNKYLSNLNSMGFFSLTLEEEKDLLRLLKKSNCLRINQRAALLVQPGKPFNLIPIQPHSTTLTSLDLSASFKNSLIDAFLRSPRMDLLQLDTFPLLPLAINFETFKDYFPLFYEIAREGTAAKKQALQHYLTLIEGSPGLNPRSYDSTYAAFIFLLRGIITESAALPHPNTQSKLLSVLSIQTAIRSIVVFHPIASNLITIARKSFQEASSKQTKNFSPPPIQKFDLEKEFPSFNLKRGAHASMEIDLENFDTSIEIQLRKFLEDHPLESHLNALESLILEVKGGYEKDLSLRSAEIENLINEIPSDTSPLSVLDRVSYHKPIVKLEEAIDLFRQGSLELYQARTFISTKSLSLIDQKIGEYLLIASRLEQLKRVNHLIQKYKAAEKATLFLAKIEEELLVQRPYLADDAFTSGQKRLLLTFEYRNRLLLRPKQVLVLKEICQAPNDLQLVAKLGTGLGKSKALMTLLEWIRNENATAVVNLWPPALFSNNRDDISLQVRQTFKQTSNSFAFQRSTPVEVSQMIHLLRDFYQNIVQKKQINATPQSFICAELKFLEILRGISLKPNDQLLQVIPYFQKLLALFHQIEIHVDESQINLASKAEVNFTIGNPKEIPKAHTLLIKDIYVQLTDEPEVGLKQNLQPLLQAAAYEKIIEKIAVSSLNKLKIPEEHFDEVKQYVLASGQAIPIWVQNSPQKDLIGLLRGEINALLKDSLLKSTNVSYGLSHDLKKRGEYAKPYAANNQPIENADYENVHETLNKTFQTYLYNGLSLDQIWTLIQGFQNQIAYDLHRGSGILEESAAYQEFQTIFPPQLHQITSLTKEKLADHHPLCSHQPPVIFRYIVNHIAPSIEIYENKLRGDAQTLKSMFKNVIALSATPGSPYVYGPQFSSFYHLQNESEVLNTLKIKCENPQESIQIIPSTKPTAILQKIIHQNFQSDEFSMLIDIGALFEGMDNLTVAKALLNHFKQSPSKVRGIVFYEEDCLMVLEEGQSEPIPFHQSTLTPAERFAYCDNQHIFGADIPLPELAKGFATFNIHVDKDSLLQGTGRLRDFLKGQSIRWGLTEACQKAVFKNQPITIESLIEHTEQRQKIKDQDDLFRSLKQQIRNVVRAHLMRKLINSEPKEAVQLYPLFADFFEDQQATSPFKMYGQIEEETSGVESLRSYHQEIKNRLEKLQGISNLEKQALTTELETFEAAIEKLSPELPSKVSTTASHLEQQVEIFNDVEKEKDKEKKKENEIEQFNNVHLGLREHQPKLWPRACDPFMMDWTNPTITLTRKVSDFATKLLKGLEKMKTTFKKITGIFFSGTQKYFIPVTLPAVAVIAIVAAPIFAVMGVLAAVAKLHRLRKPDLITEIVRSPPLLTYPERIKQAGLTDPFGCSDIYFTDNLVDQELLILPFSSEEKPIYEILIVQENGKHTLIVGDQDHDAYFWRTKIKEDKQHPHTDSNRKVCLYDLREGIVLQGQQQFDNSALMKDPDFLKQLLSIKLYNGELFSYSQTEKDILFNMCQDPEKRTQLANLLKASIKFKKDSKKEYPSSFLYALLE